MNEITNQPVSLSQSATSQQAAALLALLSLKNFLISNFRISSKIKPKISSVGRNTEFFNQQTVKHYHESTTTTTTNATAQPR